MKTRTQKTLAAAILSAALAYNGIVALSPKAYADEAARSNSAYLTEVVNKKLGSLLILAVAISDEDYEEIEHRLGQGQTLVEASRVNKEELLNHIMDSVREALRRDAELGHIASDEAASLAEQAEPIIEEEITKPGGAQAGSFDFDALLNDCLSTLQLAATAYSDEDDDDIRNRLEQGETLAHATRMQPSELLENLLAPVYQEIERARVLGQLTAEDAEAKKTEARNAVSKAITTPGGSSTAVFDFNAVLSDRLATLGIAAIAYSDDEDVKYRLEQGETLVQATRLQQNELLDRLMAPVKEDISRAVMFGAITAEEASEYTEQARTAISEAITTPGGAKEASAVLDTQAFLNEKLSELAFQAYVVADGGDLDLFDLRQAYAAGESLSSLTGLSSEELASRIADLWKSDLNAKGFASEQIDAFLTEAVKELKSAIEADRR